MKHGEWNENIKGNALIMLLKNEIPEMRQKDTNR